LYAEDGALFTDYRIPSAGSLDAAAKS
jgi:hypothetical protein